MQDLKIGCSVKFKDTTRFVHDALVSAIHLGRDQTVEQYVAMYGHYPLINCTFIIPREPTEHDYRVSEQQEASSVSHCATQKPYATGYCWSFPDEVIE